MSWLPVARRPITCQVSWIVNASAGASISRMPPSTTQPPISQSACSQPLANGQRPLTRYPPGSGVARPLGAKTPATIVAGSA